MLYKKLLISFVLIVTNATASHFPTMEKIVTFPDGDEYFGQAQTLYVLNHSHRKARAGVKDMRGSVSPLSSPEKFMAAQEKATARKKDSVKKRLQFDHVADDEINSKEHAERVQNLFQKLHAAIDNNSQQHSLAVTPVQKNMCNDNKKKTKKTAVTVSIEEKSDNDFGLVDTVDTVTFNENTKEYEPAVKALSELIEYRKKISALAPELNLNNKDWLSELRNLYGKKQKPATLYKTTLIGCYSFADIEHEAKVALSNTKRCFETHKLYQQQEQQNS